ncbi:hypothetical protein BaRGS_00013161 [Batillaria attramentaria]|uniref:Transmembrane protein n=1 Tax=Batillaria attramentaria TaxID=370345 RepID=A0ABD0L9B1_9CAEN
MPPRQRRAPPKRNDEKASTSAKTRGKQACGWLPNLGVPFTFIVGLIGLAVTAFFSLLVSLGRAGFSAVQRRCSQSGRRYSSGSSSEDSYTERGKGKGKGAKGKKVVGRSNQQSSQAPVSPRERRGSMQEVLVYVRRWVESLRKSLFSADEVEQPSVRFSFPDRKESTKKPARTRSKSV